MVYRTTFLRFEIYKNTESEFNEFEPRLKFIKFGLRLRKIMNNEDDILKKSANKIIETGRVMKIMQKIDSTVLLRLSSIIS